MKSSTGYTQDIYGVVRRKQKRRKVPVAAKKRLKNHLGIRCSGNAAIGKVIAAKTG
jgi:hypothetical protein